jgi:uncharacterized protein YndB with AHSA1/START domain
MSNEADVALIVRRTIRATPERLFEAWTTPEHLRQWWGPAGVTCTQAEVDLRVGGTYRIANQLPDGKVIWISGEFESITPPTELIYSWQVDPAPPGGGIQRVTVRFEPKGERVTEVIIVHERNTTPEIRRSHQQGWIGCLDGLGEYLEGAT